jgi:hypothetical protein
VAVGVENQKIPKGTEVDDCPERGIWIGKGWHLDERKRIPRTLGQIGEKLSIIKEVTTEEFCDAEAGEVMVGDSIEELWRIAYGSYWP